MTLEEKKKQVINPEKQPNPPAGPRRLDDPTKPSDPDKADERHEAISKASARMVDEGSPNKQPMRKHERSEAVGLSL